MKHKNSMIEKKLFFLIPAVILMMGNQKSCQQQEAPTTRQLKKIVGLEKINSRPVNLGPAGQFDFEFVVNQQIYSVLQSTDKFSFKVSDIVYASSSGSGFGSQKISGGLETKLWNLNESDQILMNDWVAEAKATSTKTVQVATESKEAWCMVDDPQAKINGAVNSFELLGGGGLSLGFTPSGDKKFSLNAFDFQVEYYQLDLGLNAFHPRTRTTLGSTDVTSNQTKTKVSFGLNLGGFTLGPSFYYTLPLAKVTKNALTSAVNNLASQLDGKAWYSRVLANKDVQMVIIGGENVNLKEGDLVSFWNELYNWSDVPCYSTLKYDGIAMAPIAKGRVSRVGSEISIVDITTPAPDFENVQIGAKVRLDKKVEDVPVNPPSK